MDDMDFGAYVTEVAQREEQALGPERPWILLRIMQDRDLPQRDPGIAVMGLFDNVEDAIAHAERLGDHTWAETGGRRWMTEKTKVTSGNAQYYLYYIAQETPPRRHPRPKEAS